MEPELRHLLDESAIRALSARYARSLDDRDWGGLAEVFTPTATAQLGSDRVLDGLGAIEARVRAVLEPLDGSQHLVGNHEVTVDGDSATHRCYFQAQHIRHSADGGPHYIVAGRYLDRLQRVPDVGWRITHRRLEVIWTEGNVAVVAPR